MMSTIMMTQNFAASVAHTSLNQTKEQPTLRRKQKTPPPDSGFCFIITATLLNLNVPLLSGQHLLVILAWSQRLYERQEVVRQSQF